VGAVRSVRRRDRLFPRFDYYLDESDPDIVVLRRQDGAFVAAFSAQGGSREGIVEAAKTPWPPQGSSNERALNPATRAYSSKSVEGEFSGVGIQIPA
jgi:hypothetical protein